MTPFFGIFAAIAWTSLLTATVMGYLVGFGHLSASVHFLTGLTAAILASAVHCLIFGIFTGSGKDTRELVQDLSLDTSYVGKTKSFRKIAFPPAMYAILLMLITAILGGAAPKGDIWSLVHGALGWVCVFYNAKTFLLEYRCVKENAAILAVVNSDAVKSPNLVMPKAEAEVPLLELVNDPTEWGTHVYALGKFLVFLGVNVWLPFIYMKVIVGYAWLPVWPFLSLSLLFCLAGWYLRERYREYRPTRGTAHS